MGLILRLGLSEATLRGNVSVVDVDGRAGGLEVEVDGAHLRLNVHISGLGVSSAGRVHVGDSLVGDDGQVAGGTATAVSATASSTTTA